MVLKERLLEYLVCPECKAEFNLIEHRLNMLNGLLACPNGHHYPIVSGVPVLIKNDVLENFLSQQEKDAFRLACRDLGIKLSGSDSLDRGESLLKRTYCNWSLQWQTYKLEGTPWEARSTFLEHIPLTTEDLSAANKLLEIGCGNGRCMQHTKTKNNMVFAVDISTSAYNAAARYREDDNVFVLRSDANLLPFRDGFFDLAYSDHVLQHVVDLNICFHEIKRVLKTKNLFIFNLYSKENNWLMTGIFEPLKESILKRLNVRFLHLLSNIPALALWLGINVIYKPIHKYAKGLYPSLPLSEHMVFWLPFDYRMVLATCFDLLHAPVAYYFSSEDIDDLSRKTLLSLDAKYLLRQTLWICRGRFIQNPA